MRQVTLHFQEFIESSINTIYENLSSQDIAHILSAKSAAYCIADHYCAESIPADRRLLCGKFVSGDPHALLTMTSSENYQEEKMRKYKIMISALAAAVCLAAAVPATAFGAEQNISDESGKEAKYQSEWVTDEDGRIFYFNSDGEAVTGEQEIDGELYLFSKNGSLKTGWRTVGGQRRYYDIETGKPVYGKFTLCEEDFYVEQDLGKTMNTVFTDELGDMYIAGEKGAIILDEGFAEMNGSHYYVTEGGKLATGEITADGAPYIFGDDGKELLGWETVGGKEYYYDTVTGEIKLGFVNIEDDLYYIDLNNGKKTGIVEIDGAEYLFSENSGKMQMGLLEINGNIKYFYDDGTFAKGVAMIDGLPYLFSDQGNRLTGLQSYGDALYYTNDDGVLCTGIIENDGEKYFFGDDYSAQQGIIESEGEKYLFDADNKMLKGWQEYDGSTYFLDETTGKMLTGKLSIDGKAYYFDTADGAMQTAEWVSLDDGVYYFGEDGSAASGIMEIEGKKYYFDPDTFVQTTGLITPDGKRYFYFNTEDGSMHIGWITLNGEKYFFHNDGVMATGWHTISEKKYYFNTTTGQMEKNKVVGDYNLTDDGSAVELSAVQKRAKSIIDSIGKTPFAIYSYVRNNNKYSYIEATRSLSQIESAGWQYFANYALNNRFVVCYYFAAVTDLLFKQAGYTTRIVYGTGRASSDHYWNQVYDPTTDTWLDYDTCNGYFAVTFSHLQTQNYTIYQYVYPKFY